MAGPVNVLTLEGLDRGRAHERLRLLVDRKPVEEHLAEVARLDA